MYVSQRLVDVYEHIAIQDIILDVDTDKIDTVLSLLDSLHLTPFHFIQLKGLTFISINGVAADILSVLGRDTAINAITPDVPITFGGIIADSIAGSFQALRDGYRPKDFITNKKLGQGRASMAYDSFKQMKLIGTYELCEKYGLDAWDSIGVTGANSKVCVIDTGVQTTHSAFDGKNVEVIPVSKYKLDQYTDRSGHGTWCTGAVGGNDIESPYGIRCRGTSRAKLCHVKALRTPLGMSKKSDILTAIELAEKYMHPNIYSMSLGGAPTDGYENDPACKLIASLPEKIFVVAAGNSGPAPQTIDTPGISPNVVTVGSWSYTDDTVSWFSGRGPSIDALDKPDVYVYGGGRADGKNRVMEYLFGPVSYLSMEDTIDRKLKVFKPLNAFSGLMGTSMATPQMAGLIARMRDYKDGVLTTDDVLRNCVQHRPFNMSDFKELD